MDQTRTGSAFATLAVAALALCLFAAAAAASKSDAGSALLARRAAMLELMHHQAEIALVTAAQDRSFEAYFRAGDKGERAELQERLDHLAEEIRVTFFADHVCLLSVEGEEIADTDPGAKAEDDTSDKAEMDELRFFRDAFRSPSRQVYLSPIFLSDSTRRWVVSYATPIIVEDDVRAILHYEHSLANYQEVASDDVGEVPGYMLLVDPNGWIIADSRRAIGTNQREGSIDPTDYFPKFAWNGAGLPDLQVRLSRDGGIMEETMVGPDGEYRVQYRTVRGWTLLLFERV